MLNNNITRENIGGIPFILDKLHIYVPYSIASLLATILGLVGNLFVILSVLMSKKLRSNQTCILILNLALSDLVISVFVHPSIVAGVVLGKVFFDKNIYLCKFLGSICLIACGTSLMTMVFLALNRYICVFNSKKYGEYFSKRNTLILCLVAWLLGIAVDLPNFLGIGNHVYDLKVLSCHFDRLRVPYTISAVVFCIVIPCICIGLLYLKIFFYSLRIRVKLKNRNMPKSKKYGKAFRAVKIAKSLFASFILFSICWLPVVVVYIVGRHDQLPIWIHTLANSAAHINSALNPILYFIYNPMIRSGYRNVIRVVSFNRLLSSVD